MQNKTFDDFNKEALEYKTILANYSKTGEVFVDKNFHPNKEIYERKVTFNEKDHKWIRIDQFFKAPLFKPDLINPDYIKQGELGDCYLLGALSRIAKQPDLVPSLFDRSADTILSKEQDSINIKCGAVVIYFHVFGRRTPILIDTLIPFKRGTRTPRFSHPSDIKYSPWFCLVEKAFAKLQGSYSDIIGGTLPQAVYSLYGYFPMNMKMKDIKCGDMPVFDKIMKYQSKGAVMGAAIHLESLRQEITTDELLDKGLVTGHAYLVIKARKCDNKNFFCLRNPWGDHEWLGDWSDTSDLWTPELKQSLGMEQADNGTFWMIDNDFFKYFTEFQIAKPIPPEWHSRSFFYQIVPGDHDGYNPENSKAACDQRKNYAFQLTEPLKPGEKCRMYILIEKRRKLFNEEKMVSISSPNYCIMIAKSNGKKLSRDVILRSNRYSLSSESALLGFNYEISSHKDIFTIILQRTQKCNIVEDCYVQLFCKYDFKLYDIDKPSNVVPEDDMFGIIFDNFSVRHKNVARPLKKKLIKQKELFTFMNDENHAENDANSNATTNLDVDSKNENETKPPNNGNNDNSITPNSNDKTTIEKPSGNKNPLKKQDLTNVNDQNTRRSINKTVSFGGIVNPESSDEKAKPLKTKKNSDDIKPILFGKTEAQVEYEQAFNDWQQMMDNLLNEQKKLHVKFSMATADKLNRNHPSSNENTTKQDISADTLKEKENPQDNTTSSTNLSETSNNEIDKNNQIIQNPNPSTKCSDESNISQNKKEEIIDDQNPSPNNNTECNINQHNNIEISNDQTKICPKKNAESLPALDDNNETKDESKPPKFIPTKPANVDRGNEKLKNPQNPSKMITVESVLVRKKEITMKSTTNSNQTQNDHKEKVVPESNENMKTRINNNVENTKNNSQSIVDAICPPSPEKPAQNRIKSKMGNTAKLDKKEENISLNTSLSSPSKLKPKSPVKKASSKLEDKPRLFSSKNKQPTSPIKDPQSPRRMKEPNSPLRDPQSPRRMKEPNSPLIHKATESPTKKAKTHLFKRNENKMKNKV